ncbi:MAG: hypothetical protein ABSB75_01370 [Candidatus Limnocylindrales bacterium]
MWGRRKGPNLVDTEEMEAFFARLDRMNREQLLALRAAWSATSHEKHEEAWAAVRAVGAGEGLAKEIDRVRGKAIGWASRGSDPIGHFAVRDNVSWQQIKRDAEEAIVDAALATALGNRLDAKVHAALLAPWLRATEAGR